MRERLPPPLKPDAVLIGVAAVILAPQPGAPGFLMHNFFPEFFSQNFFAGFRK